MDAQASPKANGSSSLYCFGDILNLPASLDLLDDEDFENTMLMLENENPPSLSSSPASAFRRGSAETLELNLSALTEMFAPHESTESPHASSGQMTVTNNAVSSVGGSSTSCLSPDMKLRVNGRTPVGNSMQSPGDVHIKQETEAPDFSPVMDSFLRESWDDIVDSGNKSVRTSFKVAQPDSCLFTPSGATGRVNPLPLNLFFTPSPLGGASAVKGMSFLAPTLPLPPATVRGISNASSASTLSSASSTKSAKGTRRAKQCIEEGCIRRAQSNNRCKTHGGGARCQVAGCDKSSQGGGLCRAHGGGKKCRVPGCSKGTQRLGLCYLHGGIRRCITEGCKKKDRGNGYCISHGGGRRCESEGCNRSVRKGNHCQMHQVTGDDSPFQISRGHSLVTS